MSTNDPLDSFFDDLRGISSTSFPAAHYAAAIQNACKEMSTLFPLRFDIPDADKAIELSLSGNAGGIPVPIGLPGFQVFTSAAIDGVDSTSAVNVLGLSAAIRCMADRNDGYGFRQIVKRDEVQNEAQTQIANLFIPCYGDFINRQLRSKNVKDLHDSSYSNELKNDFYNALLNPSTQLMAEVCDQSQNNRNFTTNLLFVYNYWKKGPGFQVITNFDVALSDSSSWTFVVKAWSKALHNMQASNTNFRSLHLSNVASALVEFTAPEGDVTSTKTSQKIASFKSSLIRTDNSAGDDGSIWNFPEDSTNVSSMRQEFSHEWDSNMNNFMNAVSKAEDHSETSYSPSGVFGGSFAQVTMYGDTAMLIIGRARDAGLGNFFSGDPKNRTRINGGSSSGGSCFRPGTQVITQDSTIAIETLREGTQILTKGGSHRHWGVCSDEMVCHSTQVNGERTMLFGFNNEEPFFTASHVFHTTTGLRAIDPVGARLENPWLKVGYLAVGHYLLHTKNGSSYSQVAINSIHSTPADCDTVHGVHMHDGLRSYHANGYLVHANYPEITIASITKLLRSTPRTQRLRMLGAMKELQPLFAKFGAHTLMDVLDKEMSQTPVSFNTKLNVSAKGARELDLHAVIRQWTLLGDDDTNRIGADPNRKLPNIQVVYGVVMVDGKFCKIANLHERTVTWSRQLGPFWEHGSFKLDKLLNSGMGTLMYSQTEFCEHPTFFRTFSAIQTEIEEAAEVKTSIDATRHHVERTRSVFGKAEPSRTLTMAASNRAAPMQNGHIDAPLNLVKRASLGMPNGHVSPPSSFVKEAVLSISNGSVSSPSSFVKEAVSRLTKDTNSSSKINRPGFQYKSSGGFSLNLDPEEYTDGQTTPKGKLLPFGNIIMARRPQGNRFRFRLTNIDKIRDAIMTHSDLPWTRDLELYDSWSELDSNSHQTFEVRFTRSDLIAQAADQNNGPNAPTDRKVYRNLTFKNIGLDDVTLPFVPSYLLVTLNGTGSKVVQPSVIREYDPTMIQQIGKRHMIMGFFVKAPIASLAVKSASVAVIGHTNELLTPPTNVHTMPAASIRTMTTSGQPPLDDDKGNDALISLSLDTTDLNTKSQALQYRTMLYHMTDSQRNTYAGGVAQPKIGTGEDEVPENMAENLDDTTKSWLKNTYIKAWITQRILKIPSADRKDWQRSLTANSDARITYFFKGKGKDCMAKSPSYNRLNELASANTILRLCPELTQYLYDPNPGTTQNMGPGDETIPTTDLTGGKRWATALYNGFAFGTELQQDVQSTAGVEKLQKICNFMSVLDPIPIDGSGQTDDAKKPLAIRLGEIAQKARETFLMSQDYTGTDRETYMKGEEFFLKDAMVALWENLINGTKGFGGDDPNDQLNQDCKKILQILDIAVSKSAREKAEAMADAFQAIINDLAKVIRGGGFISNIVQAIRKDGWQGAKSITDQVVKLGAESEGSMGKLKMLAYGSMVLAVTSMFIVGSLSAFRAWPALNDASRAKLVMSALQSALVALDFANELAPGIKDRILTFKESRKGQSGNHASDGSGQETELDDMKQETAIANVETHQPRDPNNALEIQENTFGDAKTTYKDVLADAGKANGIPGNPDVIDNKAQAEKADQTISDTKQAASEEGSIALQEEQPLPQPDAAGTQAESTKERKYNVRAGVLKIMAWALDIGLAIITGFQIYQNWKDMDTVDQILNIVSLVQQTLTIAVEVVNIAVDVGLSVAEGLASVCAIAAPVLAIIGIVLLFVMLFLPHDQPRELTEPEKWIEAVGNPFVASLPDPPPPNLTWRIDHGSTSVLGVNNVAILPAGSQQKLTFVGVNNTNSDARFDKLDLSFNTGSDKNCLFSDASFRKDSDTKSTATGIVRVTSTLDADTFICGVIVDDSDTKDAVVMINILKKLPAGTTLTKDDFVIVVPPGGSFSIELDGTIGAALPDPYRLDVYEFWEGGSNVVDVPFQFFKV